jgi:PP-loop superfamily ATP-utilizing enzyme
MDEAYGAYAEPLGMMGKQFVETRTLDFVGYFDEEQLLTDTDLEQWAKTVAGEIQISSEGREKEELNSLTNKMKVNCNSCTERQVKILNDFVERVGYHCP